MSARVWLVIGTLMLLAVAYFRFSEMPRATSDEQSEVRVPETRNAPAPTLPTASPGREPRYEAAPEERIAQPATERSIQSHPYETYSDDTLEVMAYNDAEAARLLGLRMYEQDPQEAFQWTLRAAALANSNVALQNFAQAFAPPIKIGDQAILRNYRESYIVAIISDAVGPDVTNVARMEPLMREAFPNSEEIMERLRPIAETHIERMREIQRDVTGTVSIAGPME